MRLGSPLVLIVSSSMPDVYRQKHHSLHALLPSPQLHRERLHLPGLVYDLGDGGAASQLPRRSLWIAGSKQQICAR